MRPLAEGRINFANGRTILLIGTANIRGEKIDTGNIESERRGSADGGKHIVRVNLVGNIGCRSASRNISRFANINNLA